MLDERFIIFGTILNVAGQLSYVKLTIQGKNRPNRVTWFLFALAPIIAFSAELDEGVGIQALQTFVVGFGPAMIFLASFVNRKSVWKITAFDIWCGSLSVMALAFWLLSGHGVVAIAFSILADTFAAIPTLRKSWTDPDSESSLLFLFAAINAAITLLTIDHYTFANSAFATYILVACLVLFALIQFRPGVRLKSHS